VRQLRSPARTLRWNGVCDHGVAGREANQRTLWIRAPCTCHSWCEDEYVKSYGHFDLAIYGKGGDEDADFWKSVIRQTLIFQYLEKDIDNIGVLKISARGEAFLKKPHSIELARDHDFTTDHRR
jgi:superfamily II DNA helicase RecQ